MFVDVMRPLSLGYSVAWLFCCLVILLLGYSVACFVFSGSCSVLKPLQIAFPGQ
jgi:hypothetical protein